MGRDKAVSVSDRAVDEPNPLRLPDDGIRFVIHTNRSRA